MKKLAANGFTVGKTYVLNVLKNVGFKRIAAAAGLPPPRKSHPRPARTKQVTKKIDNFTKKENPPSLVNMAKMLGVSARTIGRVIHDDLKKSTRRKTRVHALKQSHIRNRKTTSRKLYEKYLSGKKFENVVTIDEGWFYLVNCNGKRRICYRRKGEPVPTSWVLVRNESYEAKLMVVGGITGKGVLPLHRVSPKVKINSTY